MKFTWIIPNTCIVFNQGLFNILSIFFFCADTSSLLSPGVQSSCQKPSLKFFSSFTIIKTCYWYVDFYNLAFVVAASAVSRLISHFLPFLVAVCTWSTNFAQWKICSPYSPALCSPADPDQQNITWQWDQNSEYLWQQHSKKFIALTKCKY